MRKIAALLVLALPVISSAATTLTAPLMIKYDLDSLTQIYCRSNGQNGDVFASNISVPGRVTNAASSTTVTSVGSAGSFTGMAAGDVLFINRGGTIDTAVITTWTNANSVVVDTAADWSNGTSGYSATYRKTVCGTTANDGWVDVTNATKITLSFDYIAGNLGALDVGWECKSGAPGAQPRRIWPNASTANCGINGTYTSGLCRYFTPGSTVSLSVEEFGAWSACRIGMTALSDTDGTLEQIYADIVVQR